MATNPLITFKAGTCVVDQSSRPYKVTPNPTLGFLYLYAEENLIHFCWRERGKSVHDEQNLDLVILPADCRFIPYDDAPAHVNGRFFVLKFSSSPQRYIFWLQSRPYETKHASRFSERDLSIGRVVDRLLQGEEFDVAAELAAIRGNGYDDHLDDGDEPMEDIEGHGHSSEHHGGGGSGGAGPDATGGDIRREGANAREAGADGGRANLQSEAMDATTIVRNFLHSLEDNPALPERIPNQPCLSLGDLLSSSTTVPILESASHPFIDRLLAFLPPSLVNTGPNAPPLSLDEKKLLVHRVLRSPYFHQSLEGLTMAIRDGGLPSLADALQLQVANGGWVSGGTMPLGGAEAMAAFLNGVKRRVEEEDQP
ncbi:unnamed protein product [Blumeria hordei]|uniref:Pru domain-containing protein n=2 Tax=Blumeria hordei TaxID=2867405 RepID=A0A383UHN3_BLUHO|nr:ADRM1/adhesion regulating molecule 1 [Blumeria hordei DH14]SZE99757.1 unnamed protein product [Blumeria hordei]